MAIKNFFRDVALARAKKQAVMIDAVTEEAPILASMPMEEATHGLRNVYEVLKDIEGAQLVALDDELPSINAEGTLEYQDLSVLGGIIRVGEDKAKKFGSAAAYFAKKMPAILRETGANTEKSFIYNNFRVFAKANSREQSAQLSAAATVDTQYSLLVVKWTAGEVTGLFDPEGFGKGQVFDILPVNGGNIYEYTDADTKTKLVFGQRIKSYIALQLANPRNVSSIVNIELTEDATDPTGYQALPTEAQIRSAIRDARATAGNSFIYCHPAVKDALGAYKGSAVQMTTGEGDYNTVITSFDGIPVVPSFNFDDGTEAVVSGYA
jgi:hypothetical protein